MLVALFTVPNGPMLFTFFAPGGPWRTPIGPVDLVVGGGIVLSCIAMGPERRPMGSAVIAVSLMEHNNHVAVGGIPIGPCRRPIGPGFAGNSKSLSSVSSLDSLWLSGEG